VKRLHKKVHEVRTGEKLYDPSEGGGTNIDCKYLRWQTPISLKIY
jgi:hypothetical protein